MFPVEKPEHTDSSNLTITLKKNLYIKVNMLNLLIKNELVSCQYLSYGSIKVWLLYICFGGIRKVLNVGGISKELVSDMH